MLEVKVTKHNNKLRIKSHLSTIEIPLTDITAVANDETYAGNNWNKNWFSLWKH